MDVTERAYKLYDEMENRKKEKIRKKRKLEDDLRYVEKRHNKGMRYKRY